MCSFQEKMFLLCFVHMRKWPHTLNTHGNFLILCQRALLPNINYLISKRNKTPKIDSKMLKQ